MAKHSALPASLPPRFVGREAGAEYLDVSPRTFDRFVEEDIVPQPRRLTKQRRAWDVRELDAAADAFPRVGEEDGLPGGDDSWSDLAEKAQGSAVR
jgi:predicted DNA-binding transcriptional regulator AlpA